jgi:hypothetical protein
MRVTLVARRIVLLWAVSSMHKIPSFAFAAAPSARRLRFFLFAPFALAMSACPHRGATSLGEASLSTAPPTPGCTFVGKASASATEASQREAESHAKENLASEAERLGGTYVQVTGQDTKKVEMELNAVQVRYESRVYRCSAEGDDAGSVDLRAIAESSTDGAALEDATSGELARTANGGGRRVCPFGSEARPLDPSDGPGWQCARKLADGWLAEGPYLLSWSSGATRTEGSFENGKRTGQWLSYHPNGQLRERATFREGQLVGCADQFDIDGASLPPRCPPDSGALPSP